MLPFFDSLRNITRRLSCDNTYLEEEYELLKIIQAQNASICRQVQKLLWILNKQQALLILRSHCNPKYRDFSEFNTQLVFTSEMDQAPFITSETPISSYLKLFGLLKENPVYACSLLYTFRKSHLIGPLIASLIPVFVTNHSNPLQNSYFMSTIFADLLIRTVKPVGFVTSSPSFAKEHNIFLNYFGIFSHFIADVHRFYSTIWHAVLLDLDTRDIFCSDPTALTTIDYGTSGTTRNLQQQSSCVPTQRTENVLYTLLNVLFDKLLELCNIFPRSFMLLLGKYRHHIMSHGCSSRRIRSTSVDLILNIFLSSCMNPHFNMNIHRYITPPVRDTLEDLSEAFYLLSLERDAKDMSSSTLRVSRANLLANCNADNLNTFLEQVIEGSDSLFNSRLGQPVRTPYPNTSCDCLGSSILFTANDLNILIDCLRFASKSNDPAMDDVRKLLRTLPKRVPTSKFGVRITSRKAMKHTSGSTTHSETFQMVTFTNGGYPIPVALVPTSKRSRSTSLLHTGKKALLDSPLSHSNSLIQMNKTLDSSPAISRADESGKFAPDIVYFLQVPDCQPIYKRRILLKSEYYQCKQNPESGNGPSVVRLRIGDASSSSVVGHAAGSVSKSSSGCSRSSGDVLGTDELGKDDSERIEPVVTNSELPYRGYSAATSSMHDTHNMPVTFGCPSDNRRERDPEEEEDDRSNDLSSSSSQPSGSTSLASSAHVSGRRIPPESSNWVDWSIAHSHLPEHASGDHFDQSSSSVPSDAGEKRTRFTTNGEVEGRLPNDSSSSHCKPSAPTTPYANMMVNMRRDGIEVDHPLLYRRVGSMEQISVNSCPFALHGGGVGGVSIVSPTTNGQSSSHAARCSSMSNLHNPRDGSFNSVELLDIVSNDHGSDVDQNLRERGQRSSSRTSSSGLQMVQNGSVFSRESRTDLQSSFRLGESNLSGRLADDDVDDALSDLPFSSANVSGRVTPLSHASSVSRSALTGSAIDHRTVGANTIREYAQTGFVLPNGSINNSSGMPNPGVSIRTGHVGFSDFPSTMVRTQAVRNDVTEKFGKFDLPPLPFTEADVRSTVSDTWSTDVLASDTEYPEASSVDAAPVTIGSSTTSDRGHHRNRQVERLTKRTLGLATEQLTEDSTDVPDADQSASSTRSSHVIQTETGGHQLPATSNVDASKVTSSSHITPLSCSDPQSITKSSTPLISKVSKYTKPRTSVSNSTQAPSDRTSTTTGRLRLLDLLNSASSGSSLASSSLWNSIVRKTSGVGSMIGAGSKTTPHRSDQSNVQESGHSKIEDSAQQITDSVQNDQHIEESIEEMMTRYRQQSEAPRSVISDSAHSGDECMVIYRQQRSVRQLFRVSQFDKWSGPVHAQIKSGLLTIFSHPLSSTIVSQLLEELSTRSDLAKRSDSSMHVEDTLLMILLQMLRAELINLRHTQLSTCVAETERLFRTLLTTTTARKPTDSDPIAPDLIADLNTERHRSRNYFNYLLKFRERVTKENRYLKRWKASLDEQLKSQCEKIIHYHVAAFLDYQREAFKQLVAEFSYNYRLCESSEVAAYVCTQIDLLIDKLFKCWNRLYDESGGDQLLVPPDDSDFAHLLSHSSLSPETHIRQLVYEKFYLSGIWMNDVSLERQRDFVFRREVTNLAQLVSATELELADRYHHLLPFQSVQDELRTLDYSHVPSHMIRCLRRIIECIMATVDLVPSEEEASADVLLPILIYAIIQANPARLLINIAFMQVFATQFEGADQYIWCQFQAALAETRRLISVVPVNSPQAS